MVDLNGQYHKIQPEVDAAMRQVLERSDFIHGQAVTDFERALAEYTRSRQVVTCASGTDALQLALMALDLQPGDEVITVPFTFVSTVEVIALLGLRPVLVDVCPDTFNMDVTKIEAAITERTKVILPVHLFGQCVDMEAVLQIARRHQLYVIEDACQALGAQVTFSDGSVHQAGTMGHVGCTSFFPTKNLGCYGDGGAVFTQDDTLAAHIRSMANHGMSQKYYYDQVGLNSRLDTLQAAVLQVKLSHLDEYIAARQQAARFYQEALADCPGMELPSTTPFSTHTYHQYTIRLASALRDEVKQKLADAGIPTMVYYPCPLHQQAAYRHLAPRQEAFPVSESLAKRVLSLPMHTELTLEQLQYITSTLRSILS